jgi:hypothetical protein
LNKEIIRESNPPFAELKAALCVFIQLSKDLFIDPESSNVFCDAEDFATELCIISIYIGVSLM